jgi:hypothetical protein
MFFSRVYNTCDKLFGDVNDSADKFITGVNVIGDLPCHRKQVIRGIVDIGDKFITGVIDTAAQSLPVTMTPAINLSPVSTKLVNNDRWLQQHL